MITVGIARISRIRIPIYFNISINFRTFSIEYFRVSVSDGFF
jgi:hypothetical protein